MRTTYYSDDDILVMRFSDQPMVRETSQDWYVTISPRHEPWIANN